MIQRAIRQLTRLDLARTPIGAHGLRLTGGANADEIEPMLFYAKSAEVAGLTHDRLQTTFDRYVGVGYASADAADQMVMRILGGFEVGAGHPEIQLAQVASRNQQTQISVNSAQAQTRKDALDESVDLVRRQMAAVTLNSLENCLALFCVSDIH
jgi:hypothetical protein